MAAKTKERGLKRVCSDCGMHFYDLMKRPIICPGCSEEFTGEMKVKSRRGRAVANDEVVKAVADSSSQVGEKEEGELEEEDSGVEVISLDDAEPSAETSKETDEDDAAPGDISGLEDDNDLDDLNVDDLNVAPDEDDDAKKA